MFKKEQVTGVAFYCKDCEKIVDARQFGRKFVYVCNVCKTKNVAFGTEKSIRSYFHYDEVVGAPAATTVAAGAEPSKSGTGSEPLKTETKSDAARLSEK